MKDALMRHCVTPLGVTARQRRAATARQTAWRARQRDGRAVYPVTVDAAVIDLLVACGYLADAATGDRQQVSRALSEIMRDASTTNGVQRWHYRRHGV
jgi:hypothetical protein